MDLDRDATVREEEQQVGRAAFSEQDFPRAERLPHRVHPPPRRRPAPASHRGTGAVAGGLRTASLIAVAPARSAVAPSLRSDGGRLLGEVDPHRAPGDAAAAADATRGVELVPPGRQLVGQPLAVARRGSGPDWSSVQVGVVEIEARGPGPPPLDRRRRRRSCPSRRCRSRSGRPGCSSRRPGTARPPRPSGGARGCGRGARPSPSVSSDRPMPSLRRRPATRSRAATVRVGGRAGPTPAPGPRLPPRSRPGRRSGGRAVEQLGQGEVETRLGAGTGAHGGAEAGAGRGRRTRRRRRTAPARRAA